MLRGCGFHFMGQHYVVNVQHHTAGASRQLRQWRKDGGKRRGEGRSPHRRRRRPACRSKGKWRPSYKLSWMLRKSPMMIPGRVRVVVMLASALMSQAQPKAPRTTFPWCCRGEPCRWWCSLLQYFLQTLGPSHVVCSTNCNNAQCMRPSQFVRKRPPPAPPFPPPPVPKK